MLRNECCAEKLLAGSIPLILTLPTFWHVDGFLSITGWLGVRFAVSKYIKLWGVLVFYTLLDCAYTYFATGHMSHQMAGGWFGKRYLFFLFLTPFLNAALSYLRMTDRKTLYSVWIIFDIALFFDWIPTHMLSGVVSGQGPMSLLTFVAIYVNVGLLHLSGLADHFRIRHFVAAVLIYVLGAFVGSVLPGICTIMRGGTISHLQWVGWTTYNSPHSLLLAIASLLLFEKYVKVPTFLSRAVMLASSTTFGVYILHETTSSGRLLYIIPQNWLAVHSGLHPVVIIFLTAALCFVVCMVVELLRKICFGGMSNLVARRCQGVDRYLTDKWC